jgi:hypothetical protein
LTALTQPTPDALRQAIKETKKLTKNSFGVNITLLPTINPPDYAGFARVAVEEGVRIFETAGNNRKSCHFSRLLGTDGSASPKINNLPQTESVYRDSQVHDHPARQGNKGYLSLLSSAHSIVQSAARMGVDILSIDGFECK